MPLTKLFSGKYQPMAARPLPTLQEHIQRRSHLLLPLRITATGIAPTLTLNSAPAVTQQPANQTVCSGANATFTAGASGVPAPTVQWQISTDGGATFNNIAGATSTTYSFATVATDDGHQFRAVFSNAC